MPNELLPAFKKTILDWRELMEFLRAVQIMGAVETPKAFAEECNSAWAHLQEAEDALAKATK